MAKELTEADALRIVCEQLTDRFPTLESNVIELTVEQEYRRLDGPIRDFVPVLTHKLARDRLSHLVAGQAHPELVTH